jgi:hypothetical protein
VDVNRLSRGERIAGIAAVLLFIDMFMNWYGASINVAGVEFSKDFDAWKSFSTTDILIFVTCLAALVMVGLRAMDRDVAVSLPMVVAALGGLTTLIILWRIINQPGDNSLISVDFGAYLGLLLCGVLTYGAITAGDSIPLASAMTTPAAAGVGAVGDPAPPPPAPDPAPPPPAPDPAPPAPPPDPAPPQPGDDPMGPTA